MLNKLKAFVGRLTYPKDAFYDGYFHRTLKSDLSFYHGGNFYNYVWNELEQNWLGWWVVDETSQTWSTEDLREYAEEAEQ